MGCFCVLGISPLYAISFIGIFFVLVTFFAVTAPPTSFGEISSAIIYHQVRKFLLHLSQHRAKSNKYWRPSLLYFDIGLRDPNQLQQHELSVLLFANELKKGGLFLVASLVPDSFSEASFCLRDSLEKQWSRLIARTKIKALPVTTISPTLREGFRQAIMLTGLGQLRANTVM